ncbi:hypothetical protein FNV43_RR07015 [Rhamnella rubrinervis]|uniref:Mediator-associated protein 2 n=1 Tax=Rhamnella rubrinervis TaxID=2594499 RepID=A0A8K0HEG9_9ROSA|nr:hypothetical protein FNV43_RR07015 [Rhamnella rubrinervis]
MASGSGAEGGGYRPPPEFLEDSKEPLLDLSLTDSTELWLIQWPKKHNPDFDGQEVSLKLHRDGKLASFEGSSGRKYDVVSFAAQEPNATVFVSSTSGTKVVGKISRRVSLVHYPQPDEVEKVNTSNWKQLYQNSGTNLTTKSSRRSTPMRSGTPAQSGWQRHQSVSGRATPSSPSSRQKSTLSEVGEPSKPANNKRRVPERTRSINQSGQDSGGRGHSAVTSERSRSINQSGQDSGGRGHSAVTSSGSPQRSHQGKEKKNRKKTED